MKRVNAPSPPMAALARQPQVYVRFKNVRDGNKMEFY